MKHNKYYYILKVVESGIPILLEGGAGTGKTTIAKQIAEDMSLTFYTMSMTKQSSVNSIIGFTSVSGTYIPTQFRKAFENGGIFLLDEIDAADTNVLLVLNTVENGYVAFPDGIVESHKDFRLIATANPFDAHAQYTGRSKLDFSVIDRYFLIKLEHDLKLENSLICKETKDQIKIVRKVLKDNGSTKLCTMRDAIRISKLKVLDITKCAVNDVIFSQDDSLYTEYYDKLPKPIVEPIDIIETSEDIIHNNPVHDLDSLWEHTLTDNGFEVNKGNKPEYEYVDVITSKGEQVELGRKAGNWSYSLEVDRVVTHFRKSEGE